MIDRILNYLKSASAPTENDSDRDGFLSYAAEYHAVGIGAAVGATARKELIVGFLLYVLGRSSGEFQWADNEHLRDAGREPAYAIGGVLVGFLLHLMAFRGVTLGSVLG